MTEPADWRHNEFIPTLRDDLLVRHYDNEALVWSPLADSPTYLDPVSSIALQIIDGHASVQDLVTDIHEVVGVDRNLASQQVARSLELLDRAGALQTSHFKTPTAGVRDLFREPASERLAEKARLGEMHPLDLDIDGTQVRVMCEEMESVTVLRRIFKEYLCQSDAPLGFVLTSPNAQQRLFELSDRSDRQLGRTRDRDHAHAMVASHLGALLRPAKGFVRLHTRALVGDGGAATLLCWPLLVAPGIFEARLEQTGHRILDRLWIDVDPRDGELQGADVPWRRRVPSGETSGHISQLRQKYIISRLLIPGEPDDAGPTRAQVVSLMASLMVGVTDRNEAVDATESLSLLASCSVVSIKDIDAVYQALRSHEPVAEAPHGASHFTGTPGSVVSTSKTIEDSYDELSYGFAAFRRTHPIELSTTAELRGLETASPHDCRVLELGCAEGGNLLPLAEAYPSSEFVGLDLSGGQIVRGQEWARSAGISNVELLQRDIMDVGAGLGQFDYIICHGVYSWVPPDVQAKILEICRENATSAGVSYVSYNTYPRWHLKGVLRKLMLEAVHRESPLVDQVAHARAILGRLIDDLSLDSPYAASLSQEASWVLDTPDFYLAHEYLAEVNDPLYYGEFVRRTTGGGLLHLGDHVVLAQPSYRGSASRDVDPGAVGTQEYNDVVANAGFRAAILCREDALLEPHRVAGRLREFRVAAARASSDPATTSEGITGSSNAQSGDEDYSVLVASASPMIQVALRYLQSLYPESPAVDAVLAHAASEAESKCASADAASEMIVEFMANHAPFGMGLLELRRWGFEFSHSVSSRPSASPLARLQARDFSSATNRRHENFEIEDPLTKFIIQKLDGTRTVADLVRDVVRSGQEFRSADGSRVALRRQAVQERLDHLATNAMLAS